MRNRTAQFALTVFVSVLAGAVSTPSQSAASPADGCLSGPKGQAPEGSHWYYRIEHATKRHCWHLADERDTVARPSVADLPPPAKRVAPPTEPSTQHSVANARAELPAPPRVEPANHNAELAPAVATDAPNQTVRSLLTPDTQTNSSVIASRWPGQSDLTPSAIPPSSRSSPGTNPASPTQPASILAAGQFAAADLSSETPTSSPLRIQLVAAAGVLAAAGILARFAFKSRSSRRVRPSQVRRRRAPVLETTDDDRIVFSDYPGTDFLPHRARFARGLNQAPDPGDRIGQFSVRASRRASS
jgi:hypothetical protein